MAFIPQEELNEIRNQANIVDIISDYLPLTQKGKNYFGVCPFHDDHAPSMSVSSEKQIYKCFSCGASGNVFNFVADYENLDFGQAVLLIAQKIGYTIKGDIKIKSTKKFVHEHEIMELVKKYYLNNLQTNLGTKALDYLKERSINTDIINQFEIGLSLTGNSLLKFLEKKNYDKQELVSLGLINSTDTDYHDVFNKRIMFPLWDPVGNVIGFSGRIYNDEDTAKYINSKETIIFKKGETLYNYHNAQIEAKKKKEVIIVEGQMDVIRLYENGIKNVIGTMGTSLTNKQVELIKKLRCNVILCLDGDDPGQQAIYSMGNLLTKENIDVRVITLKEYKDPDEYLIKLGKEKFLKLLNNPQNFLDFKLNHLKEDKNLNDPKELADYLNKVLKELNDADDLLKEIVLKKLSSDYNVSLSVLASKLNKVQTIPKSNEQEIVLKKKKNKYEQACEKILYYLINDYSYIKMFKSKLGTLPTKEYRIILNDIYYYYESNKTINMADFITFEADKEEVSKLLKEILNNGDEVLNEKEMTNYISLVKSYMNQTEIKELKNELKQETDLNEKIKIAERIRDLKKGSV